VEKRVSVFSKPASSALTMTPSKNASMGPLEWYDCFQAPWSKVSR
jgi:hypothetical protein